MKRLIILICFFYVHSGIASQPPQKLIRRNMLIFFDPIMADGADGALKTELHAAIKFTTDVIIVTSGHIFLNVLNLPSAFLGNAMEKFDVQMYEAAGLVILIPKSLSNSGLNTFSATNKEQIASNIYRNTRITHFEKLFLVDNKSQYEWYIALNGHGSYSKRESVGTFQEDMVALYGGTGLGVIAGMNLDFFQDFLHFLNNKINTKVLYFNSCYAGELNLGLAFSNLVQMTAGKWALRPHVKPNYDIISGALTGAITVVPGGQELAISQSNSAKSVQGLIDFQNFFILAQKYFGDQKGTKRINDKQLIEICLQLDPWSIRSVPARMIAQLPQIKFVHQDFFQVVPLSNIIFVLNDVVVKNHMLEIQKRSDKPTIALGKRTIDLDKKDFVLLQSTEIEVPVRLPVHATQFISMISGPAIHVFDSITGLIALPVFARNQMVIPNVVPKYYFIQRMGEYLNIIMHVQAVPVRGTQGNDQIRAIFAYYFKEGDHYLAIFYDNTKPIEVKIPGSENLDKKVQEVLTEIKSLADASLEKRVRELNESFAKLLTVLHEASIAQRKKEKDKDVGMFLEALFYYSNARTTFERTNIFHTVFEKNVTAADKKIISEYKALIQSNLLHVSYPKLRDMFGDIQKQAHAYLIQNPSNSEIRKIEKIAEGFAASTLRGKQEIWNNPIIKNLYTSLASQAGAIADKLIARDMYQKAIDRLAPFTPLTSAKIIKTYNAWINDIKNNQRATAQRLFQTATVRATQLEQELKQFPTAVTTKFTQEKQRLAQWADSFKEQPTSKEPPRQREKPREQEKESTQRDESPDRSEQQVEMRHRLVRQFNEELSEDPTLLPYEETTETWDDMRDKARNYLGKFGADTKIIDIQKIAQGLGTVPSAEGKVATKAHENANNYYRKLRDNEVRKANVLIDQGRYMGAIELLRPFTPDTSAKIVKIYINMINHLAKESRRIAAQEAEHALENIKLLEKEFDFFGGIAPQFKEEKATLEKLHNDLK